MSLSCLFRKPEMSDSATVLEAFKFIESAAAEFSDEDEDEDSDGREKTIIDLATVRLYCVLCSTISTLSTQVPSCYVTHLPIIPLSLTLSGRWWGRRCPRLLRLPPPRLIWVMTPTLRRLWRGLTFWPAVKTWKAHQNLPPPETWLIGVRFHQTLFKEWLKCNATQNEIDYISATAHPGYFSPFCTGESQWLQHFNNWIIHAFVCETFTKQDNIHSCLAAKTFVPLTVMKLIRWLIAKEGNWGFDVLNSLFLYLYSAGK